jgi:prophage regulatory protein
MLKLMRLPEVEAATGLSGTTIWRREREGRFPRRRRVGPNAVAWRSDEVEAWIRERPMADEPEAAGVGG